MNPHPFLLLFLFFSSRARLFVFFAAGGVGGTFFSHKKLTTNLQALTEVEHVSFLKIEGAPPEEVEDLVSEKLGAKVVEVGDTLFDLVENLCTGNPLMITELVSHLKVRDVMYDLMFRAIGEMFCVIFW